MALVNYATREISAKIVYYGPGLSGKTTNIQRVYEKIRGKNKGKLVSLSTEGDRTIFFDFLPVEMGSIKGFKTRYHLYTVPGQVFYNSTRKMVLKGTDGIVFVADSQKMMMEDNVQSLENLKENLEGMGIKLMDLPIVMQYNKRDLPGVMDVEDMQRYLNPMEFPHFEASAIKGEGVLGTLTSIVKYIHFHIAKSPDKHSVYLDTKPREEPELQQPIPEPEAAPERGELPEIDLAELGGNKPVPVDKGDRLDAIMAAAPQNPEPVPTAEGPPAVQASPAVATGEAVREKAGGAWETGEVPGVAEAEKAGIQITSRERFEAALRLDDESGGAPSPGWPGETAAPGEEALRSGEKMSVPGPDAHAGGPELDGGAAGAGGAFELAEDHAPRLAATRSFDLPVRLSTPLGTREVVLKVSFDMQVIGEDLETISDIKLMEPSVTVYPAAGAEAPASGDAGPAAERRDHSGAGEEAALHEVPAEIAAPPAEIAAGPSCAMPEPAAGQTEGPPVVRPEEPPPEVPGGEAGHEAAAETKAGHAAHRKGDNGHGEASEDEETEFSALRKKLPAYIPKPRVRTGKSGFFSRFFGS